MPMMDKVRERAKEFDLLHFHIDLFHFPVFHALVARTLTTLHGRQDLGDLKPFYSRFGKMPLVSISDDQRTRTMVKIAVIMVLKTSKNRSRLMMIPSNLERRLGFFAFSSLSLPSFPSTISTPPAE
jgi:hypothetical protein